MNIPNPRAHADAVQQWRDQLGCRCAATSPASALPQVKDVLKLANVQVLELAYDGRDGAGYFTCLRCVDFEGRAMALELPEAVRLQLYAVLRELRDWRYPRWRNLEGAYGCFAWNVPADVLEHKHCSRYIDYEVSVTYGL